MRRWIWEYQTEKFEHAREDKAEEERISMLYEYRERLRKVWFDSRCVSSQDQKTHGKKRVYGSLEGNLLTVSR